ncbi:hypothetical protein BRCON_2204 [Candidatus Sumerlaea chitinivorans]|uniref:Uncharacterized protein n=1 Tax=Sumerlaea chitinivorans TaxID=2250252 RepID=A0A2Z4Y718_SUMC1|nr:hypothetical protein BRCON_2204 [Candidatus Sumerlaea chitinivorans]
MAREHVAGDLTRPFVGMEHCDGMEKKWKRSGFACPEGAHG